METSWLKGDTQVARHLEAPEARGPTPHGAHLPHWSSQFCMLPRVLWGAIIFHLVTVLVAWVLYEWQLRQPCPPEECWWPHNRRHLQKGLPILF